MITLYTTHCPKCNILKQKLDKKNIEYNINEDIETMINKGFSSVPVLEISDNSVLNFSEAIKWIDTQGV